MRRPGKFWNYHDALFAHAPQATPQELGRYADRVGLDLTTFEGSLSGGVHRPAVQRDLGEGTRLGVTGTPAFFINGRPLSEAQPLEAFARVIEEEHLRARAVCGVEVRLGYLGSCSNAVPAFGRGRLLLDRAPLRRRQRL